MGKLVEYNEGSIETIDDSNKIIRDIEDIQAILDFPILEKNINKDYIEINAFQKSFWGGQKLVGYIKIVPIDDFEIEDITVLADTILPPYLKTAIGFTFSSKISIYQAKHRTYYLGKPRNEVLSYYKLLINVDAKLNFHKDLAMLTAGMSHLHQRLALGDIKTMLETLEIFKESNE